MSSVPFLLFLEMSNRGEVIRTRTGRPEKREADSRAHR